MVPTDSVLSLFERTLLPSVVLQIPTWSLFRMNDSRILTVSNCNSGASWLNGGNGSRRDLNSFVVPASFVGGAAEIVEISLEGPAQLPSDTRYSLRPMGPWLRLFPGKGAQT